MIISREELCSFLNAKNACPHDRLGMHQVVENKEIVGVTVRAYVQNAKSCYVVNLETDHQFVMQKLDDSGFFEVFIESLKKSFRYKFLIADFQGGLREQYDPYSFLPTISQYDCYLFGQGKHYQIFKKLGSHERIIHGVQGVSFAVWAPNAKRISVVGEFNNWDGRYFPMRLLCASGIYEIFIPGVKHDIKYKYEILGANDKLFLKSDPYANYFEGPPNNASIVCDLSYEWKDRAWMDNRKKRNWLKEPISIYEVNLGSWMRVPEENNRTLTYLEAAQKLSSYVNKMGFTHVELMPLTEFPFERSWGYQVTGYFAPTSRYGSPVDFMRMVDEFHKNGIGVIMDWVPAHFPRDAFALAEFDGTKLYEHADPRQGCHEEWGTLVFNYGRHEVRNFLIASALSWFENFHIDGIRVDAVASMLYLNYGREDGKWIPNRYGGKENVDALEFLRELNDVIHEKFPNAITIAEESTSFSGVTRPTKYDGVGFDFKWNMGWMHDTLSYFSNDPIYRKYHHDQLTFAMLYQFSENFISAISHDEVVYGKRSMLCKMPGVTISEKARHLMVLYSYMWFWPGKKSLFMGCEFGQSDEWQYDKSLDWHLLEYDDHKRIQRLVSDLNILYKTYKFLHEYEMEQSGFEWVSCDDRDNSVISFLRNDKNRKSMLIICNFTPVERINYRVGVPFYCEWKEIFNSDCDRYGGQNRGNFGSKFADNIPFNWRPYSLNLYLPPLSVVCFLGHG